VACVGGKNTKADRTASGLSSDFSLADATISSSADSYKNQADLDADVAILTSPKVSSCYESLFRSQFKTELPAGSVVKTLSIKITPGNGALPNNVVGTGTGEVVVVANGQTLKIYLNVAFITGSLIEAEVDAENVGTPFSPSLLSGVITKVAERAAKA
jgi:hypothetical protein